MKFTEEKLEKAFTELLGQEGFPHHLGLTITRKPDEVLIEEDLQNFLLTQYSGQGITVNETKSIILQLKSLSASDLYESNKTFLKMLSFRLPHKILSTTKSLFLSTSANSLFFSLMIRFSPSSW
jgi:type I restriction enzyme R subunit